jgi:hypothetical protein
MSFQMMRVISSPSISTTGLLTLIFDIFESHHLRFGISDGRRIDATLNDALIEVAIPTAAAGAIARQCEGSEPVRRSADRTASLRAAIAGLSSAAESNCDHSVDVIWPEPLSKIPLHRTVIACCRALRLTQLEFGCNRATFGGLAFVEHPAWPPGGIDMTTVVLNRRNLLAVGGSMLATGASGFLLPARAQGLAPTASMWGGSNNYRKGASIVDRIGKGGFWMSGTVRRAGDGAPLAGQRIQIWAHTTEGQEHEPQSHGATLTDKNGAFRLEMPQIIPIFGQPHGHLAYDSGEFKTVFLRPVMRSAKDKSLVAHFVLQPA